jgi:hypothetical protein
MVVGLILYILYNKEVLLRAPTVKGFKTGIGVWEM